MMFFKLAGHSNTNTRASFLKLNKPLPNTNHNPKNTFLYGTKYSKKL